MVLQGADVAPEARVQSVAVGEGGAPALAVPGPRDDAGGGHQRATTGHDAGDQGDHLGALNPGDGAVTPILVASDGATVGERHHGGSILSLTPHIRETGNGGEQGPHRVRRAHGQGEGRCLTRVGPVHDPAGEYRAWAGGGGEVNHGTGRVAAAARASARASRRRVHSRAHPTRSAGSVNDRPLDSAATIIGAPQGLKCDLSLNAARRPGSAVATNAACGAQCGAPGHTNVLAVSPEATSWAGQLYAPEGMARK